jgi:hypothetical protein
MARESVMHAVQLDDLAPLHDERERLSDNHCAAERAAFAIALVNRAETARKLTSRLMLHTRSTKLHGHSKQELIALHAELEAINRMANHLAMQS